MAAQDNVALARRIYEAFNRNDLDTAVGEATDDVQIELIAFGQTFHGKEGFRQFMQVFRTAFPDITLTMVNQVASEDQVVSEFTWRGTHRGPLPSPTGDIPPTNRTVEMARVCEVWEVKSGKLAALRNYADAASWMRQLGLVS